MAEDRERQSQVTSLADVFTSELPTLAREIAKAWSDLQREPSVRQRIKSLHLRLRDVAGSAASFGMTDLASMAEPAEAVARTMRERGSPPSSGELGSLGVLVAPLVKKLGGVLLPTTPTPVDPLEATKPATATREISRVLLVEDDPQLEQIITLQLQAQGFAIEVISDPTELPEYVQQRAPVAIILGLVFASEAERIEAFRTLNVQRANAGKDPVPVIFTSFGNDLEARIQLVRAGGRVFFARDLTMLAHQVDVLCSRGQTGLRALIVAAEAQGKRYSRALGLGGMRTKVVSAPEELIEQLTKFEPDVLVLDDDIGSCSGMELASIVRQDEKLRIPIVLLTAARDEQTWRAAVRLGADLVDRPVDEAQLLDCVSTHAQRSRLYLRPRAGVTDERGLEQHGGVAIISLRARIAGTTVTTHDCESMVAAIDLLVARGERRVVLDWSGVTASATPESLVGLLRKTEQVERKLRMAFCAVPEQITGALRVVGLDKIPSRATRQEAVNFIGGRAKTQIRAKELHSDLERARQFQQRMLPAELPEIPNFELSVTYHPCGELSGDFYDFHDLGEGRVGIALGDATGHGVTAALITSICKKLLKLAVRKRINPREALERVNRDLVGETGGRSFVTLLFGILDPQNNSFSFVCAGHEALLLHRPTDKPAVRSIRPSGIPLGLVAGERFNEQLELHEITLEPGDSCVIYSDALTEAHNASNDLLGIEGVCSALEVAGDVGPKMLVELLEKAESQHRKRRSLKDDLTILSFGRTA